MSEPVQAVKVIDTDKERVPVMPVKVVNADKMISEGVKYKEITVTPNISSGTFKLDLNTDSAIILSIVPHISAQGHTVLPLYVSNTDIYAIILSSALAIVKNGSYKIGIYYIEK